MVLLSNKFNDLSQLLPPKFKKKTIITSCKQFNESRKMMDKNQSDWFKRAERCFLKASKAHQI